VEQLQNFIDPVSSILWGWLLIYVLLATGLGVLTLLNVTAILLLSQWAIAVPADYERSLAEGRKPVFVASTTPGLPTVSRDIVW